MNVAFGAYSLHEFGHAFAYLEDEYISDDARDQNPGRHSNPVVPSVFTLSNLSFNPTLDEALWVHLSPWGELERQAAGDEPVSGRGLALDRWRRR